MGQSGFFFRRVITILSFESVFVKQVLLRNSAFTAAHSLAVDQAKARSLGISLPIQSSNSGISSVHTSKNSSEVISFSTYRRRSFLSSGEPFVGCLTFGEVFALDTAKPGAWDHEEIAERHVKDGDKVVDKLVRTSNTQAFVGAMIDFALSNSDGSHAYPTNKESN